MCEIGFAVGRGDAFSPPPVVSALFSLTVLTSISGCCCRKLVNRCPPSGRAAGTRHCAAFASASRPRSPAPRVRRRHRESGRRAPPQRCPACGARLPHRAKPVPRRRRAGARRGHAAYREACRSCTNAGRPITLSGISRRCDLVPDDVMRGSRLGRDRCPGVTGEWRIGRKLPIGQLAGAGAAQDGSVVDDEIGGGRAQPVRRRVPSEWRAPAPRRRAVPRRRPRWNCCPRSRPHWASARYPPESSVSGACRRRVLRPTICAKCGGRALAKFNAAGEH